MAKPSPAVADEQAELAALREQADTTGRQVSDTAATLAAKLADGVNPRSWVRRKAAEVTGKAKTAARRAAMLPARASRRRLTVIAVIPAGVAVIVAVAVIWQHRRPA